MRAAAEPWHQALKELLEDGLTFNADGVPYHGVASCKAPLGVNICEIAGNAVA